MYMRNIGVRTWDTGGDYQNVRSKKWAKKEDSSKAKNQSSALK
jgi:hypothetical protein